ncbi:hypothetical protein FE697_014720 [Mumia zhuanghuii]|uniref:Cullin, a subunit of E3 ubiquitin ligase n=2 Tax=Mumia TaxID=1546255 RepID=A0ABW1QMZ1_9ACTN|nr:MULTISPECIES: hypothetical protein [Mumia]KAA1422402.1 hypothetical protein FE697_014720 [Mumia zhuanghuii]
MEDDLTPVLETQCGVLTTEQATMMFGRSRVRSRLKAQRWAQPYRAVVVTHNGPLTPEQRRWAHLLACPPRSVLGGLTALELDGLQGFPPGKTFVVVPYGARRPEIDGVVLHTSSFLDARDVNPVRTPPRTRTARSVVDAASWSRAPRRARVIVLATAQQGLVRTPDLRDALSRRGRCRHRALIVESYLDAAGGIQSLPERDFDLLRRSLHLPEPTRQRPVRRADGRFYLDVAWDAYGVACEIHGIPHMRVLQWDSDLMRANEIVIGGPKLLIFSSYAVRHEQDAVGDQLVRLFRNAGWR